MNLLTTERHHASDGKEKRSSYFNKIALSLFWSMFIVNIGFLLSSLLTDALVVFQGFFVIDRFAILIWSVVTFFAAIINSYSFNYLKGFKHHFKFTLYTFAFTLSVMLLVISNHVSSFILSWLLMGIVMANLIGIVSSKETAIRAARLTKRYVIVSTLFLSIGILFLVYQTQSFHLRKILSSLVEIPNYLATISAVCIMIAAFIQSAVFPFQKWLLSAMTAPTPASALMHAGFVNGSGILLAIFSVLISVSNTYDVLFVVGGCTAILAQFTKLLQTNIKQRLACSTIAQMGFMIMQCGLGFFNAAVAHLILHGFYKAYLFLSSGENIEMTKPASTIRLKINFVQAIGVLIYAALGALMFMALTGKGKAFDSGIFLTLIVAIAVGQMTYNIVKEKTLSFVQKIVVPPILFCTGILIYALIFNGVTLVMIDMPMASIPTSLSSFQIVFGILFMLGFFIMKLGIYRQIPWLYVKLLNASQPNKKTIFN